MRVGLCAVLRQKSLLRQDLDLDLYETTVHNVFLWLGTLALGTSTVRVLRRKCRQVAETEAGGRVTWHAGEANHSIFERGWRMEDGSFFLDGHRLHIFPFPTLISTSIYTFISIHFLADSQSLESSHCKRSYTLDAKTRTSRAEQS